MNEKGASRLDPADLRRRAEEQLREKPADPAAIPFEESRRLVHELQVHQVELEMQNDELRKAQLELEVLYLKYFDLYDMAPVGYFTVSGKGVILEANLAAARMLGVARAHLVKKPLSRWVAPDHQDIYYLQRKRLLETGTHQAAELRVRRQDDSLFWVRMELDASRNPETGEIISRVIMVDTTAQHEAREALANAGKDLEKRVDERTAELSTANKLMMEVVAEGKRTEEKLSKSRQRLRNLSARLQSMLEEERTRISREIHDELGQTLTAMKMDLSLIRRRLVSDGLVEQSAKVLEIELGAAGIIRTVRKIATELRPGILDELGVVAAIEWMAKDFESRTGIRCKVAVQGLEDVPETIFATAIFRIVQETLTNVMRHAAASQVNVILEKKENTLILEVRDNGIGIKEERIFDPESLGLAGIRERVLLCEGETVISGTPGEGTVVRVTLPFEEGANSKAQRKDRG